MKTILLSVFILMHIPHCPAGTRIIAHRGYWNCEGSAQNSIEALKRAQQEDFYGSEFDVLLTADGISIVNHDRRIGGRLVENMPYDKIKNTRLKNGESLPALEEYLIQGREKKSVKLILEIKPHKTEKRSENAAEIIAGLVKKHNMEDQVEYISFSLAACRKIKELLPASQVSYLKGDMPPEEIKKAGLTGIDYNQRVYKKNPTWIKDARKLGLKVNTWTVNEARDMIYFISQGIDYITTDNPMLLKKMLD